MLPKPIYRELVPALLASLIVLGQTASSSPHSLAGLEFPVIMRQSVTAGSTSVGTRLQAKLTIATLVNGVVVPEGAVLSGEVVESVAKSSSNPSRLSIRLDSAQWRNGSAAVRVYLSKWCYPATPLTLGEPAADPMSQPRASRRSVGGGSLPDPNAPAPSHFPTADSDAGRESPSSDGTPYRVPMKDVESTRNQDGIVTLTARRFNLKLDKQTTYVFVE